MINCIIIDDDAASIMVMKSYITNIGGLNLLDAFQDPKLASDYFEKNLSSIDLIFLDVEMPGMTGLEFMRSHKNLPPVILVTSKEKYAVAAFEHKAVHYLVKPFDYDKFLKAVERVFELYNNEKDNSPNLDYIFLREGGLLLKVTQKEIMFCEALGDYVKVHLKDKTHAVYSTMKNMEDKLRRNKLFVRVHRGYIINISYLENFDAETAVVGGKVIPIGSKFKSELQARLNIV